MSLAISSLCREAGRVDERLVVVAGAAEDALDELLHALELVRIHQVLRGIGVEPVEGGFFRRGGFSRRGGFDSGKFNQNGGDGAFTTMQEVIIAGKGKGGFPELAEDLDDQGKPRHGTVDLLGGLLPGFLGRVNFRLSEHTKGILPRNEGAASNDQIGILHVENWRNTPEMDGFAQFLAKSAPFGIPKWEFPDVPELQLTLA
jgi:hypothetical protein